jgi:hypothetical protein
MAKAARSQGLDRRKMAGVMERTLLERDISAEPYVRKAPSVNRRDGNLRVRLDRTYLSNSQLMKGSRRVLTKSVPMAVP